ncbi:hypothetical protein RGUI_1357 [Rhodovulum sp. P5]|uniref:hypothetical protein n=1 Tax=Rhodovulum sp. P5 TaxID=1564506 RepID=UPI0009C1BF66|nr:hypothetical protein [Rhodovulum sp. P5]ARE39498.1 hypothetical protein RGUI_1357 [Rhodovulum sp. P5]
MQLPAGIRAEILEFIGSASIGDAEVERMLNDVSVSLDDKGEKVIERRPIYDA